jgi:hypothetical protein
LHLSYLLHGLTKPFVKGWSAADTAATFGNPAAMNAASVGAYIVKFAVGSDKVAANPNLTAATKMLVLAFEYTTTTAYADATILAQ